MKLENRLKDIQIALKLADWFSMIRIKPLRAAL
jgi:hypothetical protein